MTKEPDQPAPGWRYYFRVDVIDAAAERVRRLGGAVTMGPHQVPGGNWVLHGRDPLFSRQAAQPENRPALRARR